MPRFLAAQPDARLLPLPWHLPLSVWPAKHLVALPRGISRHVVRFIQVGGEVFAAKELLEGAAMHEYRMLTDLVRLNTPAVEPMGVVTSRRSVDGEPLDSILLTKHLQFSLPYRSLFSAGVRPDTVTRLIDAMAVLLARLHLVGFLWGDVSLSNILFRRDAGEFAAYLVDAETAEVHDQLSDGQRLHDLDTAMVNLFGEFSDLEAGGMLDPSLDPLRVVDQIVNRYRALWHELTGVEEFSGSELARIEGRVRRLNDLGFDVAELDIQTSPTGETVRIQPKVVDSGHHSRRLLRLTGLDTEENQARRLLNDLDTYRAHTNQTHTQESVVAHQWLTHSFGPVVDSVPADLRGKREPAQIFHEVLDYRWYQSQREQRDVPLTEAVHGYIHDVLSALPDEELASTTAAPLHEGGRELLNPFEPSYGFADDEDEEVEDPWQTEAHEPGTALLPDHLDIEELRRRAARD